MVAKVFAAVFLAVFLSLVFFLTASVELVPDPVFDIDLQGVAG